MDAERYKNEFVTVVTKPISYEESCRIYSESNVNAVFVKESEGIYGLTSILDSFNLNIPLLTNKTEGLAIDVDGMRIGKTVDSKDVGAVSRCLREMQNDEVRADYKNNLNKASEHFNMHSFAKAICDLLKESTGKE